MKTIVIDNGQTTETRTRQVHNISMLIALAVILLFLTIPGRLWAASQRYILDFGDSVIHGNAHTPATLFLKKTLIEQYPGVDLRRANLERVILVAKSRHGMGGAQLRIGNYRSDNYRVDGDPWQWQARHPHSFDRVFFSNPKRQSRGPWQIDLRGNFTVRKVVLLIDDDRRPNHHDDRHGGYNERSRFDNTLSYPFRRW